METAHNINAKMLAVAVLVSLGLIVIPKLDYLPITARIKQQCD